ncbi:hypothetical protein D9611_003607 [Ephemerocybe angulata]|uniref:glucan 1,3-beta-glucosidase n=1 Tax=Ephemerocybe angulata TaxID=980116 RepID=A0A8H5B5J4_9AGAR|nr:hypothetical protein D9611_003607 [Tulosesus angulatus]
MDRPLSTADSLAAATHTPLPAADGASLKEPQPHFLDSRTPSSVGQGGASALGDSTTAFGKGELTNSDGAGSAIEEPVANPAKKRRTLTFALIALLALAVVVLAVILPVYFKVIKKKDGNTGSASSSSSNGGSDGSAAPTPTSTASPTRATTGGDGSTITAEDGTTFTYANSFGGIWVADPDDPYNDGARPNSWTPALNETFDYGKNRMYGVNLGGLFVLEPFISPALFQKYPGTVDEWSLSVAMAADTASGGLNQLEEHYKTFITEKDIAEIAGAGLNYVRLPVPYWAIEVWPGEPFLEKVSWKYIVRLLQWCRKYGIRVNLDLHTVPGSANGYNHGGKANQHNFLNGVMGYANAQRGLNYIRVITEFISQPEWKNVVPMFSILNEPIVTTIGRDTLRSFYLESHKVMRDITGFGEGKGPYMVIHDSFQGLDSLAGFTDGADRIGGDVHPYFAFSGAGDSPTIDSGTGAGAGNGWPLRACNRFASMMNDSRKALGVSVAGEFSNAFNDCGLYLRGVNGQTDYAGDCGPWNDYASWSEGIKAGIKVFAGAQMDNLGDWFFWTWKIGESSRGTVEAPLWSYQLGLQGGWMPTDPRTVVGTCASVGGASGTWDETFAPAMTGGAGAGLSNQAAQYPWPPTNIAGAGVAAAALPSYTATGPIVSLPAPTFTDSKGKSISRGSGWFDAEDTALAPAPVAGCTYPDAWDAENAAVPAQC